MSTLWVDDRPTSALPLLIPRLRRRGRAGKKATPPQPAFTLAALSFEGRTLRR